MIKKKVKLTFKQDNDLERTHLAEERTLYSKERTLLNTIGLFIAVIGLGLAMYKFFQSEFGNVGIIIILVGALGTFYFSYKFYRLDKFVKQVEEKNREYFIRLKKELGQ